ncbi:MAG: DJ-1/PfpI family protein [Armatimonadota bacterium]|nr:DJ-1/PfpI family protein [Armatimonadota bacterium]MCX7777603.1 DJ-1/PfpI family protein [Armatimonadota bacterium]MDW8024719.1 DJ-1/PfpI family protein [Armatimonadota bacterium]
MIWHVVVIVLISAAYASTAFSVQHVGAKGKQVLMIIASKDFRDEELLQPKELLEAQGVKVTIASTTTKPVKGMLGVVVKPHILIKDVDPKKFDAFILVGGVGAAQYWDDKELHSLLTKAFKLGKVVGAICISPVTLANAGLLKGRKATVWASEKHRIEAKGAIYTGASVQIDGNIVTASGPDASKAFGEAILKLLSGVRPTK